jgi:hypothetical protein
MDYSKWKYVAELIYRNKIPRKQFLAGLDKAEVINFVRSPVGKLEQKPLHSECRYFTTLEEADLFNASF